MSQLSEGTRSHLGGTGHGKGGRLELMAAVSSSAAYLPPVALPAHDQHLLSLRSASIQTYRQHPLIRHHREPGGADLLRARRLPTLRVLLVQGRDPDANGAQKQPCLQQFLLYPEPQDRGAGMDGECGGQGCRTPEGGGRTRNRVSMAFGSGQERSVLGFGSRRLIVFCPPGL